MTGYESKKAAAIAKTIDEVNWADHEPDGLAQPAQEQEPTDIAALVEGMEVSIDVSTGDHDAGHRLYGTVTLAQENQGSKHGLILLVQDPQPNFKAQPAQEPVAWCSQCGHKCPLPAQEPVAHLCKPDQHGLFAPPTPDKACKDCFPVYTTPPQRPWVGLTDEQLYEIVRSGGKVLKDDAWEIVEKLQAKLKENT